MRSVYEESMKNLSLYLNCITASSFSVNEVSPSEFGINSPI